MQIIKSSKKGGGGGGVVNLVADIPAWRINESLYWYFWVVTIIIDEVTIALPLQSSLTTSVRSDGKKKKQPKSVLHIQSFCFAYVHVSVVTVVPLTLLVATQKLWKTCNKIDIRTYPRKGLFMNLFHFTIILYLIVYPIKWSVCGRTNKDLADKSQALQSVAALSRACRSSPVI